MVDLEEVLHDGLAKRLQIDPISNSFHHGQIR